MPHFRDGEAVHVGPMLLTYRYELVSDHGWKRSIHAEIDCLDKNSLPTTLVEELTRRVLVHVLEGVPQFDGRQLDDHDAAARADDAMQEEYPGYIVMNPARTR